MKPETDLTAGVEYLRDPVKALLKSDFGAKSIKEDAELDRTVRYTPNLQFRKSNFTSVVVELSETPFPAILEMRRTDITDLGIPVEVYAACPSEAARSEKGETEINELVDKGFGLIVVSDDSVATVRHPCSALKLRVPKTEFLTAMGSPPATVKRRLQEAYRSYQNSPSDGLDQVCDMVEALISRAASDAVKKSWTSKSKLTNNTASQIDELQSLEQLKGARAALAKARGFTTFERNKHRHAPKTKAEAIEKVNAKKKRFLEAVETVGRLQPALKKDGLSGRFET